MAREGEAAENAIKDIAAVSYAFRDLGRHFESAATDLRRFADVIEREEK